jgi:Asp-tRNA(Asn)/Glu-tRNA(Gln) amidotransferase A subunit family amidase
MLQELAAAVREGHVHPRELVAESLRRIEARDPEINAVVALRADEAMAEAEVVIDDQTSRPLAGIPLLVKDLTPVAGMVTTYGSSLYTDAPVASDDGAIVTRLRAAGAIVVGKTNTPAFGHTAFTDNLVFGATRNPWNLERSPGGSSGGSAAALTAGLAPLATTSDGGGSVRIPASLCGLVGYKPTTGVIGRQPLPSWMTFSTSGGTAGTVADAMLEVAVMAGPTTTDIFEFPTGSVLIEEARPGRVVACPTLRAGIDPAVATAFDRTVRCIESDLHLPVTWIDHTFTGNAALAWFLVCSAELAQALAWCRDRWDSLEPSLEATLSFGSQVSAHDYIAAQRQRFEHAAGLEALLGDDGVLVTPTCNVTSWGPHGPLPDAAGDVSGDPAIAVNTPEFNLTGNPAVSVPIGVAPDAVPIGMQIVGPRFGDRYALGLAAALEQAQPWPLNAPGYEPFGPS